MRPVTIVRVAFIAVLTIGMAASVYAGFIQ